MVGSAAAAGSAEPARESLVGTSERNRKHTVAALPFCALLLFGPAAADIRTAAAGQGHEAIQSAALLVQQGRLDDAERQARRALPDPETQAVAYSILGTIRFQQKRLGESASFFEQAIGLEPRLLGAHLSLAQIYTLQAKPKLALEMFKRILVLDPSNALARLALARSETEKGNYHRSLELAQPALDAFKQSPEGLFVLATNFLKIGNRLAIAELVKYWTRLAEVPQEWSIRFGLLLAREGVVAESINVLESASKTGAPSFELAFNLAGTYLLHDEPARALDTYDVALRVQPDSVPALRQAAAIAERQAELERSLSYWIRAKKIEPDDAEILLGFGRVCLKMDLLEDAEPALIKAASMRPDEPSYQYTLAAVKVGKRQYEAAQRLLERLVEKRPLHPHLQYALGSVLYSQGHLAEAAARLRESVRLQPEQLASHYYLALVARDLGDDAAAIDAFAKLLERYPEHAGSCEALGGLLMNAQRYSEAESHLRKAVKLNPTSAKANYQLGLLLARMGRKNEADEQLGLAQRLRKDEDASSRLQVRLLDPDQLLDSDR